VAGDYQGRRIEIEYEELLMSYILDALKKADMERRRGRTPDFMDPHGQEPQEPKKRIWIYVLLAMLVAVAGSLGWYFGHDDANLNEVKLKPAPVQTVTDRHTVQAQISQPAQMPKPAAGQSAAAPSKQLAPNVERVTDTRMPAKPSTPQTLLKEKFAVPAKTAQAGPPPEPRANPKRIYSISELPDSVKQELPVFSISTHIYSPEPSERLVSINGYIGREGKELMQGIVLDSVVPDGAILKCQGYRFKVELR
jgi:general secretion pathway protein B